MNSKTMLYIVKRILLAIFTVWVVITVTFFVMHAVPGGPFVGEKATTPAVQAAMEAKYGLDKPLAEQYFTYLKDIITKFDFGPSLKQRGRMVIDIIGDGMKTSAKLGVIAAALSAVFGIVLGAVAALRRNKLVDRVIMVITTAFVSMPSFIMGSLLAETPLTEKIHEVIKPVKDLFGAVFFVSVGMMVSPMMFVTYFYPIVLLTIVVMVGLTLCALVGFTIAGQNLKTAILGAFSLAQVGEFAFIIASLGVSLGVLGDQVYPIIVAVSVITTFTTPMTNYAPKMDGGVKFPVSNKEGNIRRKGRLERTFYQLFP